MKRGLKLAVVLFLLGLVFLKTAGAGMVYHDNVVIVLDASGSMDERMGSVKKIDAAKTALKGVIKEATSQTQIGLVVFSASNLKNEWVYPLGPRDDAKLKQAIDLPRPGGNTPLAAYIKKGADRLLLEREKQFGYGSYRLLIVTDGEANVQTNLVDPYTFDVMSRGITVDVIGVNMAQKHTLATKVHSYRLADNPDSLKRAIEAVFAEVGGVSDDKAGADDFQVIAPLPSEMASAIIKSLSASGNHPIGEKPKVKPTKGEQQSQAAQTANEGFSTLLVLVVFFAVVIFGIFSVVHFGYKY